MLNICSKFPVRLEVASLLTSPSLFFFPASLPWFPFCSWVTKVSFIPVIGCHQQMGHMSVADTSLRSSCSMKSGDPRRTDLSHSPVPAGQDLPAKSSGKGKASVGRSVIPSQEVNPCPIKRLSIIKHFLFVRHFIVIFIGSFY